MTEPLAATEQIEAELVLWRVFGLSTVYEDRPRPWWSVTESRGPSPTDQLHVYVGDLVGNDAGAASMASAETDPA